MICICSYETPPELLCSLSRRGYDIFPLPRDPSLPADVSFHTDLLVFILEDVLLVRRDYYRHAKREIDAICQRAGLILRLSEATADSEYPRDCGLCAAVSGKSIICRQRSADPTLLSLAQEKGYSVVNVPQGYAKCSCAVLPDGAVITSDAGIAKALRNTGADVLLISPGHVRLPGYDYGFIGGASGVSGNTLYFCGRLEDHPDHGLIMDFAGKHSTQTVSLSGTPLFDVGSLYFI